MQPLDKESKLLDCEREKRVTDTIKLQWLTRIVGIPVHNPTPITPPNDSHDSSHVVSYLLAISFVSQLNSRTYWTTATNSDNGL